MEQLTNEKTEAGKKMHCLHKVESLAILYTVYSVTSVQYRCVLQCIVLLTNKSSEDEQNTGEHPGLNSCKA